MFSQIFGDLWSTLKPPKVFSWQTLLLASFVLWGASFVVGYFNPGQQQSLSTWGLSLLTLGGIFWAIDQKPITILGISMGPWMASILVSTFIYRYLNQVNGMDDRQALHTATVVWPLIAALLKIIPDLVRTKPRLGLAVKPVHRTGLAIFIMVHIMMTYWIHFGFVAQDWANELQLAGDVSELYKNSLFVVSLDLF
ncbi:MAG: DUF5357 family protein [Cyanobacteria bacterium P01_C01_bin.89]